MQNAAGSNKYFVLRIGNKYKLEFTPESERVLVGTGKKKGFYRVLQFCDLETKAEYRLVTNLPKTGEGAISDEEVWKFIAVAGGLNCYGSRYQKNSRTFKLHRYFICTYRQSKKGYAIFSRQYSKEVF
ncbi:MAG TPA: hypothetical protein DEV81_02515, partial [Cyanobacteria bacterium UBA11049]|nr:hypothetical protein [Cyanobacteria bacterium UBA11049]